jgi:Zn finger protein HypA/HybF involved in hydrogenase expression
MIPDEFVPEHSSIGVVDEDLKCADCGLVAEYGYTHGGEWVCRRCDLIRSGSVQQVSENEAARCECGNETRLRERSARYVCPHCREIFRPVDRGGA